MKEIRQGWIKQHKRSIEDLQDLNDAEYRYFWTSCLVAVWDKRSNLIGTFDARGRKMKELLPMWGDSKINSTKNALLEKGYYKGKAEYRLEIVGAGLVFGKNKEAEYFMRNLEQSPYCVAENLPPIGTQVSDIKKGITDLYNSKRIFETEVPPPWKSPSR